MLAGGDAQLFEALDDGGVGHDVGQGLAESVGHVLGQAGGAGDAEVVLGHQLGYPSSTTVGTSGSSAVRLRVVTASALIWPVLIIGTKAVTTLDAHRNRAGDQVVVIGAPPVGHMGDLKLMAPLAIWPTMWPMEPSVPAEALRLDPVGWRARTWGWP